MLDWGLIFGGCSDEREGAAAHAALMSSFDLHMAWFPWPVAS